MNGKGVSVSRCELVSDLLFGRFKCKFEEVGLRSHLPLLDILSDEEVLKALWIWFPPQVRIYFFHTVFSLHLKEYWGWIIEACFLFQTGALGRLWNQSDNSVGFMPGTCQSKIIIANPLCYQSKGYWGWQGQTFFKCLYCACLVLCLGKEELLWIVLVDFFSIKWQLTALLNLPQRASFIGLLRKQPGKKVGGEDRDDPMANPRK